MSEQIEAPAAAPCAGCPYRLDSPSGLWAPEEYAKLPAYDRPMVEQPPGVFMCHRRNGRVCAGWVGCHDTGQLLAVRLAAVRLDVDDAVLLAILNHTSPVPLHPSGTAAAVYGMRDVDDPGPAAIAYAGRLRRIAGRRP